MPQVIRDYLATSKIDAPWHGTYPRMFAEIETVGKLMAPIYKRVLMARPNMMNELDVKESHEPRFIHI